MAVIALLSFKKVFNFGKFLAVTPPYNFQTYTLENNICFKLYVIIGVTFPIIGMVLSMHYRNETMQAFRTSVRFTDVLNEISLFGAFLAITLDLCVFKASKWNEILKLMHFLNQRYPSETDKKSTERFITAQVFLSHFLFIGVIVFQWEALIRTLNLPMEFVATYIIHYLTYFKIVYTLVIMNSMLFNFEKKFKSLNNEFQQKFLCQQRNVTAIKRVAEIRKIEFSYRKLSEAVTIFNTIFGTVIILTIVNFVINVIVMINLSLISNQLGPLEEDAGSRDVLISNILATSFTMGMLCLFVIFCQRVVIEAQTTLELCYMFQEQVSTKSDVREEIWKLISVAKDKIPVFTAAGFFELNKGTLMSIFSTVTTYVIVLIQINMSMY